MARVIIPSEDRAITEASTISDFLKPHGIWYERWETEGRLTPQSTNEEILAEYGEEVAALKARGNFITADVINVDPNTPNLDAMLQKFSKEHTHDEDEVRFTVEGQGVFHIHPASGPVFAIEVESGDLINVPRGTQHWFNLCEDRHIRCIRLFEDSSGWTPHYIDSGVHHEYQPLCLGPNYVGSQPRVQSVIQA